MDTGKVAIVAVAVLAVAAVAFPTAAVAQTTQGVTETGAAPTDANATADDGTGNASMAFGTRLTAFMQSSAAETNDTVDSGMWEAAFERANESKRARMAHRRTDSLDAKLERLRARNRTLTERYENGSLNRTVYVARASALSGRIAAFRSGIDSTERVARGSGINETRLDELRENASNMTGPAVAGVARGLVAGDRGPPADRGNRSAGVPGTAGGQAATNGTLNASVGPVNGGGPLVTVNGTNATRGDDRDSPLNGGEGADAAGEGVREPGNGNPGPGSDGTDGASEFGRNDDADGGSEGNDHGGKDGNPAKERTGKASSSRESGNDADKGSGGDGESDGTDIGVDDRNGDAANRAGNGPRGK